MIVYVVELDMPAELREEYMAWLTDHVRGMLALPGFLDAMISARIDPPPPAGRFVACVHYQLRDRATWQAYLAEHAPRMRAAGIARFGDRVQATRTLLETP